MEKKRGLIGLAVAGAVFSAVELARRMKGGLMSKETAEAGKIYSFEMNTIDGKAKSLAGYKGKVLLLVNTASLCGFTPQYDGLEELYGKYKDKGLCILGFPANNFGAQEPGPDSGIKEFCRTRFSISFDLFSKISVKGADIHPLYKFLTTESGFNGDVTWNFAKFLVDREGKVAARFGPNAEPTSKGVVKKVEELLG